MPADKTVCVKMDERDYDVNDMVFIGPKNVKAKSGFEYDSVIIKTKNRNKETGELDGTQGSLIIRSVADLYCKGLEKGKDFSDPDKFKWQIPISLQDRDPASGHTKPTEQQARWMANFDGIFEHCIDWIMDHLKELGLDDDFPRPLLKNFSPVFYAKEKDPKTGKATKRIAEGAGPWLYTKTMYRETPDGDFDFSTMFFNKNDVELPYTDAVDTKCQAQAAFILESLYCSGEKIYPQLKMYELVFTPLGGRRERVLGEESESTRLSSDPRVRVRNSTTGAPLGEDEGAMGEEGDVDETGSIGDGDQDEGVEEEEPTPPPKVKAKPKTTVKVVKRKPKTAVAAE